MRGFSAGFEANASEGTDANPWLMSIGQMAFLISLTIHLAVVLILGRGSLFPPSGLPVIEFARLDIRQIIQTAVHTPSKISPSPAAKAPGRPGPPSTSHAEEKRAPDHSEPVVARTLSPATGFTHQEQAQLDAIALHAELNRVPHRRNWEPPAIRIDLGEEIGFPKARHDESPNPAPYPGSTDPPGASFANAPRLTTLQIMPPIKQIRAAITRPLPGINAPSSASGAEADRSAASRSIPIDAVVANSRAGKTSASGATPQNSHAPALVRRIGEMPAPQSGTTPPVDLGHLSSLPRLDDVSPRNEVRRMDMPVGSAPLPDPARLEHADAPAPGESVRYAGNTTDIPELMAPTRRLATTSWSNGSIDQPAGEAPLTPTAPSASPRAANRLRALNTTVGGGAPGTGSPTGIPITASSPNEQARLEQARLGQPGLTRRNSRSASMPEIALPQTNTRAVPRASAREVSVPALADRQIAARNADAAAREGGPKILFQPHPRVPQSHPLYRSGEIRSVKLAIVIDLGGLVNAVRVEKSCGDGTLDALAVEAVRRWRYSAGPGDYRSVTVTYDLR